MAPLQQQIESFSAQLATIRAEYGSTWTVFLYNKVQGSFPTFDQAADFAFDNFGEEDFLIRHTYEEPQFAPFIMVD